MFARSFHAWLKMERNQWSHHQKVREVDRMTAHEKKKGIEVIFRSQ
jgi:hypothetical protein